MTYTEEIGAFFDRGECFKWLALRSPTYNAYGVVAGASGGMPTLNGRYIRLTFEAQALRSGKWRRLTETAG